MNKVPRVALDNLGCKLNQAETELLSEQLDEAGYKLVSSADKADVYILNTCTVTHIADRKSRQLLRRVHRQNPGAKLVAVGCYAERLPRELARIDGVELVLGNEDKLCLARHLKDSIYPDSPVSARRDAARHRGDWLRTRAFIKIQDGCNSFCTYCIVPLVRGREKSAPAARVIAEVRQRVAGGCKEVVLTGTEVGTYESDGFNLKRLLERILSETEITRLRLSSLQPQEISAGLVGLWRDQRLCPHFHLSLQSGSEGVLRRMKRRYKTADYRRAVSLIRNVVPDAAITTDVIVGFPGETEAEFQESYDFCRQAGFARIHVFAYSPRQGTEAVRMPQQVDDGTKKERTQKMLALAEESARRFRQKFLGRRMPVLWEKQAAGIWSGLTGNYIRVYTESNEDLTNKLLPVRLKDVFRDGVRGDI